MKLYFSATDSEFVYTLTLTRADLISVRLDSFDRLLIDDCANGNIPDKLLALETIARRIEEAMQKGAAQTAA